MMRKMASAICNCSNVTRVMVHETDNGVYLFHYAAPEDGPADGDQWFESVSECDEACLSEFGIGCKDWITISDPLEGCQQDWITPVRVKGRNIGKPQWGHFERLEDGEWTEIKGRSE